MKLYYMGIDVGGTKIEYGLFDADKNLVKKYVHPTDRSLEPEKLFDGIVAKIKSIFDENNLPFESLDGVGLCLPSFVKADEGYILMTSNLPKIKNFPARDYLKERLNTKVVIDNDGNAAAIAEFRHGAGRGNKHMLYCPVSTGVSSAIIIDGKLFRGSYGWAGESGHTLITPGEGIECGCENQGCFMSHISGSMITRRVVARIEEGEKSIMPDLAAGIENIKAEHIIEAYHKDDELAIWAIEHMAEYMGLWLFNIYQILNINLFVFGGGLVNFGAPLFDRAIANFRKYNHIDLPVEFKFAELGEDFGIIGALELLFDN